MKTSTPVNNILGWYNDRPPGVVRNLAAVLNNGKLAGTGKVVFYPVDQHHEHSPHRLFGQNPAAYSPEYPFEVAEEGGVSALAITLDRVEPCARKWAHRVPLVLKVNSSNSLVKGFQHLFASVEKAVYLGCVGIGYTIYPGSDNVITQQIAELQQLREIAHKAGLFVVVWSYTRGGKLGDDEKMCTGLDVTSIAVNLAATLGDVVKVKLPEGHINALHFDADDGKRKSNLEKAGADAFPEEKYQELQPRLEHLRLVAHSRLLLHSGGDRKAGETDETYFKKLDAMRLAGCNGPIVGRKVTKLPKDDALAFLGKVIEHMNPQGN